MPYGGFTWHQYQVVGRVLPTEKIPDPTIYRMKVWANNEVHAKSKFWYFLRRISKAKKGTGQILSVNELFEKKPTKVKNYGIWIRYNSRTGVHNMYKEFRDNTLNGAVAQLYIEMNSRHRVRAPSIQIIKTAQVPSKFVTRESIKQFIKPDIKFPVIRKLARPSSKVYKTTFKSKRPNVAMY